MKRIGFVLAARRHGLEEYQRRYRAVRPEALPGTGRKNCWLFPGEPGLLIGYVEPAISKASAPAWPGAE